MARSSETPKNRDAASREDEARFAVLVEETRAAPHRDDLWDALEDLAARLQRPDEVSQLMVEVAESTMSKSLAESLGERATRFHGEWFGDDSPALLRILTRVLEVDPANTFPLEKLSVVLTGAGRFDELLSLYDRALAAATTTSRRLALLDEAANVAKDFAGDADRAIGYLQQIWALRPSDAQLAASLERLFERQGRHRDLIDLWKSRIERGASPAEAASLRARIARCFLDELGDAASALAETRQLLDEGHEAEALPILERILVAPSAIGEVRERALLMLRSRYEEQGRGGDVIRILELALERATRAEEPALRRDIARRLGQAGKKTEALEQLLALLLVSPDDALAEADARALAAEIGALERFAEGLVAAADGSAAPRRAAELLSAAAEVRAARGDVPGAIALYQRVLATAGDDAGAALPAARRLADLLATAQRSAERLDVLDRLAALEPNATARKDVLAEIARESVKAGDADRALAAWQRRFDADPRDVEALSAKIDLLVTERRWPELVAALRKRTTTDVPRLQKRADLVRIAELQAGPLDAPAEAIATWREVAAEFGEDAEVVDALAALYERMGDDRGLAELLSRAGARDVQRVTDLFARAGDVLRERLADAFAAAARYRDALRVDPGVTRAREGLRALVSDPAARPAAVAGLVTAYEATGDWRGLLDLLEARLEVAPDAPSRVRILREAATLREVEGGDAAGALEAIAQALVFAPEDLALESQLVRLAALTRDWGIAARALGEAAAVVGGPRALSLTLHRAHVLARELGDHAAALEAYEVVAAAEPARRDLAQASVASALACGRWDAAMGRFVAFSAAIGRMDRELLDAIEGAATAGGAYGPATAALEAAIAAANVFGPLARDLEKTVARWHLETRADAASAEAALVRALDHDPDDLDGWRRLVELRRAVPSRALHDALWRVAALAQNDVDALHEAAELAMGRDGQAGLGDDALIDESLHRLWDRASRLARREASTEGTRLPIASAAWALENLVARRLAAGAHREAFALLLEGAALPLPPERRRALRVQAADLASGPLADPARAIDLYRAVLDEAPADAYVADRLAVLFERGERFSDLLALRKQELERTTDVDRRLALRLDVARLVGELERRGGRVEALRANLDEHPGHAPTIDVLSAYFRERRAFGELADLLAAQAQRVENIDPARAAALYAELAALAEGELGDVPRAIAAHRKVVSLAPTVASLDALARLYTERGEPKHAVEWLERRLAQTVGAERTAVALDLARALLSSGQKEGAIQRLEAALAEDPASAEIREILASLYREQEAWAPLGKLLADSAAFITDEALLLERVRDAAEVFVTRLRRPDLAVAVLETGVRLAPDDRAMKTMLAEAYRTSGRLDEARGILESLVADFGRRRSAERATLHQNLARVYDALGDVEQALAQLDLASSMDANNTGVFLDLGRLARQAGQLDRAERAYRALLMLVRRQTDESVDAVGIPEVQFELSRLAAARHEHGQARELLESAIAGATQNDLETLRFVRALRDREEFELSRRVLEERLAAVTEPSDRAPLLVALGDVLADGLGRPSEALEAWLDALACRPTDDALILKARGAARASGRTSDFVDAMRDKASKLRRQEDAVAAAHVLLAVGRALEEDAADLSGARDVYRRVEQSGHRVAEARTALARVAAGLGDAKEEARVLELLVEEEHGDATTDGLYRLAALRVAASGDSALDAALDTLDRALARQPRWDVAGAVLRAAAERAPGDERVLSAYERVARQAGDRGLLLDYLERRAALPTGSLDEVREGAAVAVELGLRDRAEALLQRGVEIARDGAEGLASAIWTLTDLAAHRRAAGDVAGAMRWLQIALDAAYPEDAPALAFELATLACAPGGDLEVAALALERLRERDPADRRVWEPLLDVYQRIGDLERLGAHVAATLEALLDPVDRNAVRLSQARFLLERGADKEAIGLLRDALGEDPEHAEAAALLADVLQRLGSSTELVELVQRQLDGAKDKGEPAAVAELSLKLVGLYDIEGRRDDALDVVRSALDFAPDDRRLLETLVRLVGTDAHPRDRAEAMERLLAVEEGDAASRVATELAEIYTALEDDEAVERVLVLGHRRAPADDALRTRLGDLLRARGDHEKLAAMLELDGMRTADATRAVVWLREAAALYRDALGRPTDAARALRAALAHARDDADLLADLIGALAAAGDLETAIAEVSAALGRVGDGTERARLLCERGKLRLRAGDDAAGIADLEEAFALAGPSAVFDLADGLDLARQRADAEAARAMTFRLVDVLGAGVDPARARDVLAEWVSTAGDDVEALRVLARVDAAAERWGDVVDTCARLLHLEEGDAQVKTALLLADAAARVDRPDEARAALEHVFSAQPGDERIRDRLRALYTELGADRELAAILMADAEASVDGDVRFASFRRAGELLMRAGDVPAALSALGAAREIRKDDHDLTVALVDAYIASGMYPEAGALLEEAIAAQGKRRTPELAQLQHRMGRLAGAAGARDTELEWYKVAMESDKNNGDIAADLAELAMHLGDSETALKALRAITLMKQTGRMSRAVAFLRQAQIAAQKGDTRRAILWGRKAKEEDPDLAEADAFLREVGDA